MPALPIKKIEIDYAPRIQFLPFHRRRQRWACLVCHRRAGKTVAAVNDIVRRAVIEGKRDGRYGFIAPYRQQAKDIAWTYLKKFAGPLLREPPRESDLSVALMGGQIIRLYGADNPDAIRGAYFDGVVPDEFADMRSSLWGDVVRPMLTDRQGWATFIGTPKGKNGFYDVWKNAQSDPEWYTLMLKASESGIIPKNELDAAKKDMGEDRYAQEFECSFEAAIKGAFYANELRDMQIEGRLHPINNDQSIRVHTAWDLGVSDSTAIWFIQVVGRERRMIDYYETSGVGLDHYAQVLHDKRMKNGWRYGDHYFPHDVAHRELSTGKSRVASLAALGIEAIVVPESSVLDGINVTRRMLGRTYIDPLRCERGLEALRQYRREFDERLKDFKANPLHDWSSHGADALRTFACGFEETVGRSGNGRHREPKPSGVTHWSA